MKALSILQPQFLRSCVGVIFMPKNHNPLTAERLRELLSYEPETGDFHWRVQKGQIPAGAKAGAKTPDGYVVIKIDGVRLYAHRLAWLHVHGKWPDRDIDHRDGFRSRNAIANLREASCGENSQNRAVQKNSKSKHIGIQWRPRNNRWAARIAVNKKRVFLGYFVDLKDAVAARAKAKAEMHIF